MERYDYYEAVTASIEDWLDENYGEEELPDRDTLYDEMWIADSVTGNASGSYTFNAWQAEENLAHNWALMETVAMEWCDGKVEISDGYAHGAEWWDVSIRCYLLGQCLDEVLEKR